MKGTTAIVGVVLIAAVALVGYNEWKKSQTTISVGPGGVTARIGAAATAAGIGAISNLGTSLGNALAGGVSSLFNGGAADNVDSTGAYG